MTRTLKHCPQKRIPKIQSYNKNAPKALSYKAKQLPLFSQTIQQIISNSITSVLMHLCLNPLKKSSLVNFFICLSDLVFVTGSLNFACFLLFFFCWQEEIKEGNNDPSHFIQGKIIKIFWDFQKQWLAFLKNIRSYTLKHSNFPIVYSMIS